MQQGSAQQFKSMAYDHPAYIDRKQGFESIMTAGSGGLGLKFVAFAALSLFALHALVTTAGTSTATATVNGTATVHINAQALNVIVIQNTASAGVAPSLSTSTIGPLYADQLYANGTYTGGIGAYASLPLNTATGSAGLGGLQVPEGAQFYVVSGTDATAVALTAIDYQIQPLAQVTA